MATAPEAHQQPQHEDEHARQERSRSLSKQLSAISARIRAMSREGRSGEPNGTGDTARSPSTERVGLHSSGRGGLGNIRPPKFPPVPSSPEYEQVIAQRGRDALPKQQAYSTGRGGSGNIKSASGEQLPPPEYEMPVLPRNSVNSSQIHVHLRRVDMCECRTRRGLRARALRAGIRRDEAAQATPDATQIRGST